MPSLRCPTKQSFHKCSTAYRLYITNATVWRPQTKSQAQLQYIWGSVALYCLIKTLWLIPLCVYPTPLTTPAPFPSHTASKQSPWQVRLYNRPTCIVSQLSRNKYCLNQLRMSHQQVTRKEVLKNLFQIQDLKFLIDFLILWYMKCDWHVRPLLKTITVLLLPCEQSVCYNPQNVTFNN